MTTLPPARRARTPSGRPGNPVGRATVTLARLPAADRVRVLERLDELRILDRLMRERGTLAEPGR